MKKGHGVMKKGHNAVPFYFSLDKTLVVVDQNIKNVSNRHMGAISHWESCRQNL
jgi:hypothetical protein